MFLNWSIYECVSVWFLRARYVGHSWRSKDELISDVLLWTSTHGLVNVGRTVRTYMHQFCAISMNKDCSISGIKHMWVYVRDLHFQRVQPNKPDERLDLEVRGGSYTSSLLT